MTIIKVDPQYKPLVQMPYCCAPCSFLWILHRRGYWVDQEEIAEYCDLHVPRKSAKAFMRKVVISEKHKGVYKDFELNLNKILEAKKIPLAVKYHPASKVKDSNKLIIENLKEGNDILLCFHDRLFSRYSFNGGHCVVVSEFDTKTQKLVLGDPSQIHSKFWAVPLAKIIKAMDKKYDGKERGFIVVSPK